MKCDIDLAIQQLPPALKFVLLAVDIDGRNPSDCAYWLDKTTRDIMEMEDKAVRRIAGILSGQTDFRGGERDGAGRKSKAKKRKGTF
jgi:DNA-directed RNA polymerase specialized sigma24 family protein